MRFVDEYEKQRFLSDLEKRGGVVYCPEVVCNTSGGEDWVEEEVAGLKQLNDLNLDFFQEVKRVWKGDKTIICVDPNLGTDIVIIPWLASVWLLIIAVGTTACGGCVAVEKDVIRWAEHQDSCVCCSQWGRIGVDVVQLFKNSPAGFCAVLDGKVDAWQGRLAFAKEMLSAIADSIFRRILSFCTFADRDFSVRRDAARRRLNADDAELRRLSYLIFHGIDKLRTWLNSKCECVGSICERIYGEYWTQEALVQAVSTLFQYIAICVYAESFLKAEPSVLKHGVSAADHFFLVKLPEFIEWLGHHVVYDADPNAHIFVPDETIGALRTHKETIFSAWIFGVFAYTAVMVTGETCILHHGRAGWTGEDRRSRRKRAACSTAILTASILIQILQHEVFGDQASLLAWAPWKDAAVNGDGTSVFGLFEFPLGFSSDDVGWAILHFVEALLLSAGQPKLKELLRKFLEKQQERRNPTCIGGCLDSVDEGLKNCVDRCLADV